MSNINRYYTGVGSRKTPHKILKLMKKISKWLSNNGYTLRSGGAIGADKAFEDGSSLNEIYLANFPKVSDKAMNIASKYHPAWHLCSSYVKKLHGRNVYQVLGLNLNMPSRFLICWTPDGCKTHVNRTINTGGTGTSISIADAYGVKVFNLKNLEDRMKWRKFISK